MLKSNNFMALLIAGLLALSALLFFIQLIVFHEARETFYYILQDLAFLPIQVLIVSLVLERILRFEEKKQRLNKQNMVIGTFFSEMGTALLRRFSGCDGAIESLRSRLLVKSSWTDGDFRDLISTCATRHYALLRERMNFGALKNELSSERSFLLSLLENPNLLEHEQFTDLLWATFHLLEELSYRKSFECLPASDLDHLMGDAARAYRLLMVQWVSYLQHLQKSYPYLFSLALRTNPFDANAAVEVV